MDEQNIRHLLFSLQIGTQKVSYTGSKQRSRWLNISCPFAPFTHKKGRDNTPSFGITINDEGRSHYKCLSCGIKGRLSSLPTRLGGYRNRDYSKLRHWAEMAELQASIYKPVIDWEDLSDEEDNDDAAERRSNNPSAGIIGSYPRAVGLSYLRERGIIWPTPLRLDLRYDASQCRILFPCYLRGEFKGFTGRSTLSPRSLSKRNPKVRDYFGLRKRELFLDLPGQHNGPKVIVEGLFDYARLVQAGFPSTKAILGTSLTPEKLDILMNEGDPVYFFMDNDLAGWQALFGIPDNEGNLETANAWAFQLYTEIPVWIVPYTKPFDGTDPGSLPSKDIEKAIRDAWIFTGNPPMDDLEQPNLLRP